MTGTGYGQIGVVRLAADRVPLVALVCLLTFGIGLPAAAQPGGPPPVVAIEVPAPLDPEAIALRPDAGPTEAEQWTAFWGQSVVRNVQRPTLLPVKPAAPNGRVVLVVPGGGYRMVSLEREGRTVAKRLAEKGYTAYVLKYRVQATPRPTVEFQREFMKGMSESQRMPREERPPMEVYPPALEDAQDAMRLVRRLSAESGLQADRIAYLGFSAGARTGVALVTAGAEGTRPETLAVIYGPQDAVSVSPPLPALFVVHAADDPLLGLRDLGLVRTWLRAGQLPEMHLYERGGHGFALTSTGATSQEWFDTYLRWLDAQFAQKPR